MTQTPDTRQTEINAEQLINCVYDMYRTVSGNKDTQITEEPSAESANRKKLHLSFGILGPTFKKYIDSTLTFKR